MIQKTPFQEETIAPRRELIYRSNPSFKQLLKSARDEPGWRREKCGIFQSPTLIPLTLLASEAVCKALWTHVKLLDYELRG